MTGFDTHAHCTECKHRFDTPAIREGYVRCPACDTPMFEYRKPDEHMKPSEFMALLHPRANEAIVQCRAWFTGGGVIQSGKAASFVMRLWPTLAQLFAEEEQEPADA
jgi:DNA-directed RNA polymerase subunit RPC12/RpoP